MLLNSGLGTLTFLGSSRASSSADPEVRLLDEVLRGLDWSEGEADDSGWRGQTPIHPRVLGGIGLYAMLRVQSPIGGHFLSPRPSPWRGEGEGFFCCGSPLTLTLSPQSRGEGTRP